MNAKGFAQGLVVFSMLAAFAQPPAGRVVPTPGEAGRGDTLMPQATGGPDDYGYTWNDVIPFSWVDAKAIGVNTGLTGKYRGTGPITLPFSFKYYQNTYNAIYVTTNGTLGFAPLPVYASSQPKIPFRDEPNNVIAPFWAGLDAASGGIYTAAGGTAPNRWWVAEWEHVTFRTYRDGSFHDQVFTFEAALIENGDIEFRYHTMDYGGTGAGYNSSNGIEDASGTVGMQYAASTVGIPNGTAIRFTRPGPAARVNLLPKLAGSFATPGSSVAFMQVIENFGDAGTDTYDLLPTSNWPVAFFAADGQTPLSDSNGNGIKDTGAITQGGSRTIVISVTVPAWAAQGQTNNGQLLVRSARNTSKSRSLPLRVAVPLPFVQDFASTGGYYSSYWRPMTGIYQPGIIREQSAGYPNPCGYSGCPAYDPVVAVAPNGTIIHVFTAGVSACSVNLCYDDARQIEATFMDRRGYATLERTSVRLTDNHTATKSLTTTLITMDFAPSVAVAPNGRIAVAWIRQIFNQNNSNTQLNAYYMVLASNYSVVVPATNLTNNTQWALVRAEDGGGGFYRTQVAATTSNRFFIGWQDLNAEPNGPAAWYAVRDSAGVVVKTVTQLGAEPCSRLPRFLPLANGTVFVYQQRECGVYGGAGYFMKGNLWTGRMDGNGNISQGMTAFTAGLNDAEPDAIQLPGGNVILAWHHYGGSSYNIQYAVFNSTLSLVKSATNLPRTSPNGDAHVSVTYAGNQAILTWGEVGWLYQDPSNELYFASLDATGNVLLPPMVFASSPLAFNFRLAGNGQTSAPLPPDTLPPTNPVTLNSNPAPGPWSVGNIIHISWSGAADDDSGLDGYSFAWDHAAATLPDTVKDAEQNATGTASAALADGQWYFHIRARDNAGNWAAGAKHLGPFRIDRAAPANPLTLASSSHVTSAWSARNVITVSWAGASDGLSGVAGYSLLWDHAAGSVPDAVKEVGAITRTASPTLADGAWYFHIRAVDGAGNVAAGARHIGPFKIDRVAPQSSASSPPYAGGPFAVSWSGTDGGAGVAGYDVQARDGLTGTWADWLTNTAAPSAVYTSVAPGHVYYFRSRARDAAGNVETALPADGDAQTEVARLHVSGQVINNRAEAVFNASIAAEPAALLPVTTDGAGRYDLWLSAAGAYTLTAQRHGYGTLPTLANLSVVTDRAGVDFVLPPAEDAVANGGFESGDLTGWTAGGSITATVDVTAAHSGAYGLRLEAAAGVAELGRAPLQSTACVTQELTISSTLARPALSWLGRVAQGGATGGLVIDVTGVSETVTSTLALSEGAWAHGWLDVTPLRGQGAELRVCFEGLTIAAQVELDEVSLGDTAPGAFAAYLPVVTR